jgi:isopentenyldiphosphate isomerase
MSIPHDWVTHVKTDGTFISWVSRKEVHMDKLIHRSINILVFHEDGRLLIQQRAGSKETFPLHWDLSCSGHVDYEDHPQGDPHASTEAFFSAARRELKEELGIEAALIPIGEYAPFVNVNIERSMFYKTTSNGPFVLQTSEVAQWVWIDREQLRLYAPRTPLLDHICIHMLGWE